MKPTMLYAGQADNSNWVVGNCNENRYYYFNTYPWLHSSPIANIKTKSTQLHHLESIFDKEIDSVWLKIKTERKTIVIATIYKPPTANNTRLMESLEEVMLDNSISQCDIIITGDINSNWYNESPEKHQLASLMVNTNMN